MGFYKKSSQGLCANVYGKYENYLLKKRDIDIYFNFDKKNKGPIFLLLGS